MKKLREPRFSAHKIFISDAYIRFYGQAALAKLCPKYTMRIAYACREGYPL